MRHIVAVLIGAATLATAVVSVRLHHHVAQLRYRLGAMESTRGRAERALREATAEYEAAKAPRRLMERWRELREGPVLPAPPPPAPIELPAPDPAASAEEEAVAVEDLLGAVPAPPVGAAADAPVAAEGGP